MHPRIKLKREVDMNPYSSKNYNIGGSSLSTNPITNPVNSYKFSALNQFRSNATPNSRGEIMRNAGNNIIN